tara:strand:- start:2077 stop:2706 length:630 start_codon:yes stop_codon:yes gene_type:complete
MHLIHRGIVNKNYKENLLNSFKASFKKGYGIETDIHATLDNQFICFHDFTLKRIHKTNGSVKSLNYSQIKKLSGNKIPLLEDLLKISKNKFYLFIEIKPLLTIKLIKKLIKETKKFNKCVFISFKEKNIYRILKINKKIKVGLSFSPITSIKTIVKKSNNKYVNCLILDKFFLEKTQIQKIKKEKYFYTIKKKSDFRKYSNNNLIFENL